MRVFQILSGVQAVEHDSVYGDAIMNDSTAHWVYDSNLDVLCHVELGGHISAVLYLIRNFYGYNRVSPDELDICRGIINQNMAFYNSKVHDTEYFIKNLPKRRLR